MYENFHFAKTIQKQRENMVTIIKNYIMIEEKPMEIALATDNPYEVLEQAKNMNDIGC
ncbi:accessory gene regulator protein A [Staphylococcus aureus]|nr:accessory gene regulator protein A [Staphylococcus aureus]